MIRKLLAGVGLAAALIAVGCENKASDAKATTGEKIKDLTGKAETAAKEAAEKGKEVGAEGMEKAKAAAAKAGEAVKETTEKAKEMGKEALEAAKKKVVEPIAAMYPQVEEKLKGLTGDAATKAKEKFELVKKLVKDFTDSPAESMDGVKTKLVEAVAELKKMIGL
jgi:hypothetical protein